jgi:8-oxo-dGTP pyrophosphatase MutT (NUDIX family)
MNFKEFLQIIPDLKKTSLPGKKAHEKIMRENIRNQIFKDINHLSKPKKSSVLCLIYPGENSQAKLVFILRKNNNSSHAGQISFPGGKKEEKDPSDYHTALREAHEEVGICPKQVQLIRNLTEVFIPVSNYKVKAFWAFSKKRPDFIKQEEEVEKILEFDLDDFLLLPKISLKKIYYGKEYSLKAFQSGKWLIWGATAMILSEIVDIIQTSTKS